MKRLLSVVVLGSALLGTTIAARGQAPGAGPFFGTGGYLGSGYGLGSYGAMGYGYYAGVSSYPVGIGNGPSPYYSPVFNMMAVAPDANKPYTGPGGERAGWAIRPSLPFTGTRNIRLFHRH